MASEKNAFGNCQRCGWKYPLRRLKYELQPSGKKIRVCSTCMDPYNIRDEPGIFATDEDTSVHNEAMPIRGAEQSLAAFDPVGNVPGPRIIINFYFA